mgnify:CR=1 FL=1
MWDANYAPLKALDYGVGGDKTQDVLRRIAVGHFDKLKPKVVVLMIGTNNTGTGSKPAEIADGVTAILQRLARRLPNTKILLLAIFPARREARRSDAPQQRGREQASSSRFADGERVHYRDIGKVFLRDDGVLTPEIMPDMLHLSPKGYQLWAEAMDPELKRLPERIVGERAGAGVSGAHRARTIRARKSAIVAKITRPRPGRSTAPSAASRGGRLARR